MNFKPTLKGVVIDGVWHNHFVLSTWKAKCVEQHWQVATEITDKELASFTVTHGFKGGMTVNNTTGNTVGQYPGNVYTSMIVFGLGRRYIMVDCDESWASFVRWDVAHGELAVVVQYRRLLPNRFRDGVEEPSTIIESMDQPPTCDDGDELKLFPALPFDRIAWGQEGNPMGNTVDGEAQRSAELGADAYIRWSPSVAGQKYEADPRKIPNINKLRTAHIKHYGALINPRHYADWSMNKTVAKWMQDQGMTLAFWDEGGYVDENWTVDRTLTVLHTFAEHGVRVIVEAPHDSIAIATGTGLVYPFEKSCNNSMVRGTTPSVRLCTSYHEESYPFWWRDAEKAGFVPIMRLSELLQERDATRTTK